MPVRTHQLQVAPRPREVANRTLDNDADSIFNESVAFLTAQSRTAQAR